MIFLDLYLCVRCLLVIICLPLRETYIVLPSVYVRPSVRMSVCYATLVRAISPRTSHRKKMKKKSINNIPTEVVQQKIKIQFCQKLLKFWPKNHFLEFVFCPGQISVTIKDRDTGFFCSTSKNIPIVQR